MAGGTKQRAEASSAVAADLEPLALRAAARDVRAATARGPVALAERRHLADSNGDAAVDLERDERAPAGSARRETQRAVDGVDDPAARPAAGFAALFPEERVARPLARDDRTNRVLGGFVDLGYEAAVGFVAARERAAEARHRDRTRRVGESMRECEVRAEIGGHLAAFLEWQAGL